MLKTCPKSSHSGFSLVELMIAIAVLGVILSIAAPSFRNMILNTRVRNAAESVLNGLQRARAVAISNNTNILFTISPDSSWNIDYTAAYKLANPAVTSPIEVKVANEGTKDVVVNSKANDGVSAASVVTFDNLGRRVAGAQLAEINFSTIGGTRPLRVIIGVQIPAGVGNPYIGSSPKMCDPHIMPPNPLGC